MRKILLTIILCIPFTLFGQTYLQYRYWFDGNDTTLKTDSASSSAWELDLDASALNDGIHFLHIQVADSDNEWSAPQTRIFAKIPVENANAITYWFDNETTRHTIESGGITDIDVGTLDDGIHFIHTQLKRAYSPVQSRIFIKMPVVNDSNSLHCIISIDGVEYKREEVSATNEIIDCSIDVNALSLGLHQIQIVLQSASGDISSIKTALFYRTATTAETGSMQLCYAIDENAEMHTAYPMDDGTYMLDLSTDSLEIGLHTITCIFIDENGMQTTQMKETFIFTRAYNLMYFVDGELVDSTTVEVGEKIIPLGEPTKEGYIFSGWSEIPETMPAYDVTITGSFVLLNINGVEQHDRFDVYNLKGVKVATDVSFEELENILEKGIYIINGKKHIIK